MTTVDHTLAFELDAPADELFPLFSPEGETAWVPGWTYAPVVDADPLAEDGVFLTRSHDHAGAEAVWLVKRFDPEHRRVSFYKVEPGEKVGLVDVRCRPLGADRTEVEVRYRYTALSEAGEAFVAGFTGEAYAGFIGEWATLLRRHLAGSGA